MSGQNKIIIESASRPAPPLVRLPLVMALLLLCAAFAGVASAQMTINTPTAVPNAIFTSQNSILTASAPTGGVPPYTYQWYSCNKDPYCGSPLPIYGQTGMTYTFTPISAGAFYFEVVATDSTGSNSVTSKPVLVEVVSQSMAPITTYYDTGTSLEPLIVLAIAIDAAIVAIGYMLGALMGNQRLKQASRSEFLQVIGTAIIAGLVLASLVGFGYIYVNSVALKQPPTGLAPLSDLKGGGLYPTCEYLAANPTGSGLDFLGPALTGGGNQPGVPSICGILGGVAQLYNPSNPTKPGNAINDTYYIDYPLAATGLILANLTNQTASNLNDTFVEEAYLKFLTSLSPSLGVCVGVEGACGLWPGPTTPLPGDVAPILYATFSVSPYAGLDMVTKAIDTIAGTLYLSLGAFVAQLIFVDVFLYVWPFLIFAGLILRGLFFTRKLGGLLIAVAIGAVLFYPMVSSVEFLAANNSLYSPALNVNVCGNGSYQVNFYVQPQISQLASWCQCWPSGGLFGGGLVNAEFDDWLFLNSFGFYWGWSFVDGIAGWIGSHISSGFSADGFTSIGLPDATTFSQQLAAVGAPGCGITNTYSPSDPSTGTSQSGAEFLVFSMVQAYGIIGVTSYFVPILNILITIAAIRGLSGLMGGDVDLAGLSRFV